MSEADLRLSLLASDIRAAVEGAVERFDEAWQHGQSPPEMRDYLPAGPGRRAAVVELIHVDLERRLKRNEGVRVESYLERFPEIAGDHSVILSLIAVEHELRRRREPDLRQEEYGRRFPLCAAELRPGFLGGPVAGKQCSRADGGIGDRMTLRITFTVTAGPHQGQEFRFEGHDTFIVGRSKQAHFRLPQKDEYFSRVHFLVEVNPPQCRLLDMGSTNGTLVNGSKLGVADLHDGDLIQGGQTVLRVKLEPIAAAQAPDRPATHGTAEAPPDPPPPRCQETLSWVPARREGACPACGAPAKAQAAGRLCGDCEDLARQQQQPIPGYRIVRELGHGAMGVVSLAARQVDGAVVALKTIRPTGDVSRVAVERFLREADILRQLDHPHIVGFREMGEANSQLFFAMDYVRGTDAARLLKQQGPLPIARAVSLVCQVLEALAYAHGKGFVHRDVKPSNVLVAEADGRETATLADFGLARVYQASKLSGLTMMGQPGGTVAFMAPEQVTQFREAKPAADQYAAAATLYYLLTDRYIFDFPPEQHRRLLMVLQDEPVPLRTRRPDVPEELARVVHRALAKEVEKRFGDVGVLQRELGGWGGQ
jgi:eukaryotic-like serine/threonine-protein kinase